MQYGTKVLFDNKSDREIIEFAKFLKKQKNSPIKSIWIIGNIYSPNKVSPNGIKKLAQVLAKSCPLLEELYFQLVSVGNDGAEAIARAIPKLPKLIKLNFTECKIDEKGGHALIESFFKAINLCDLNLMRNNFSESVGISLARMMGKHKSLRRLQYPGNVVTERVAREFLQGVMLNTSIFLLWIDPASIISHNTMKRINYHVYNNAIQAGIVPGTLDKPLSEDKNLQPALAVSDKYLPLVNLEKWEKLDAPFFKAAKQFNLSEVRKWLDAGADVNADTYQGTALPLFGSKSDELTMLLVERRANIDAVTRDMDGRNYRSLLSNLLYQKANRFELIRFLIGAKVNVNTRDPIANENWTPLHIAVVIKDNLVIVKLLLGAGADYQAKDKNGLTPADLARKYGNNDAAELIENEAKQMSVAVVSTPPPRSAVVVQEYVLAAPALPRPEVPKNEVEVKESKVELQAVDAAAFSRLTKQVAILESKTANLNTQLFHDLQKNSHGLIKLLQSEEVEDEFHRRILKDKADFSYYSMLAVLLCGAQRACEGIFSGYEQNKKVYTSDYVVKTLKAMSSIPMVGVVTKPLAALIKVVKSPDKHREVERLAMFFVALKNPDRFLRQVARLIAHAEHQNNAVLAAKKPKGLLEHAKSKLGAFENYFLANGSDNPIKKNARLVWNKIITAILKGELTSPPTEESILRVALGEERALQTLGEAKKISAPVESPVRSSEIKDQKIESIPRHIGEPTPAELLKEFGFLRRAQERLEEKVRGLSEEGAIAIPGSGNAMQAQLSRNPRAHPLDQTPAQMESKLAELNQGLARMHENFAVQQDSIRQLQQELDKKKDDPHKACCCVM